ncbi:uncharacterized protein LACBIDRAFT_310515 [Laccaria bicolor S238N-H82]|uniref:Predicted protein n=1 Tax=Laccaria bicolor (strain S238N-H82 / ATCC MYA-4686) TaxID=486041 RepID=B0DUI3_LACBS|nr:uncharacterized protein LACBIDRAFT_310515 [Laccaria bicolor S238N-H82]EDR01811.1 predicted protein [Laccaria bicolor S238N-H82]|eukprot:XP_001887624.1 predicted protein [Laccaria bicolor S238N-H82]
MSLWSSSQDLKSFNWCVFIQVQSLSLLQRAVCETQSTLSNTDSRTSASRSPLLTWGHFARVSLAVHLLAAWGKTLCLCRAYGFAAIITCICFECLFFAILAIPLSCLAGIPSSFLRAFCLVIYTSHTPLSFVPLASPTSFRSACTFLLRIWSVAPYWRHLSTPQSSGERTSLQSASSLAKFAGLCPARLA